MAFVGFLEARLLDGFGLVRTGDDDGERTMLRRMMWDLPVEHFCICVSSESIDTGVLYSRL